MGNLFVWLAIVGILVIIGVGIWCLRSCEGKLRTCLFWDTVVFLAALAFHFGGNLALGFFGLAWRSLPGRILPTVLLGSSLTWILLALCCFLPQTDEIGWVNQGIVILFAAVAFLIVLWMGLFIVGFRYSKEERIVRHQGRTFVEECDSFPNESYTYFEYYGPLVCGSKGFYGSGHYGNLTGSEEWLIDS